MANVKRTSMLLDRDLVHAGRRRRWGHKAPTETVHAAMRHVAVVRSVA